MVAGQPAKGGRVLGSQAEKMLVEEIPTVARRAMKHDSLDADNLWRFVLNRENSADLRHRLGSRKAVTFIADGADCCWWMRIQV